MGRPSDIQMELDGTDWFWPAVHCEGSVATCLQALTDDLHRRSQFIAALQQMLVVASPARFDAVTELAKEVGFFENSLQFRLGMLSPERSRAWFRPSATTSFGPFQSSALQQPVFAPYATQELPKLKSRLRLCWHEGHSDLAGTMETQDCLWLILLRLKQRLNKVGHFPHPFEDLKLADMPEALPEDLRSKLLTAFLLNVKNHWQATAKRLEACYRQLMMASEAMWACQKLEDAAKEPQEFSDSPPYRAEATAYRERLRERRQEEQSQAKASTEPRLKDLSALHVMGFPHLPTHHALRQRYIDLARRCHPDINGGNEEAFKELNSAYRHLIKRVPAPK